MEPKVSGLQRDEIGKGTLIGWWREFDDTSQIKSEYRSIIGWKIVTGYWYNLTSLWTLTCLQCGLFSYALLVIPWLKCLNTIYIIVISGNKCIGLQQTYILTNKLTLISPPPFPVNCDIINIHEHNLHVIIIFGFLFVSK